MKSAYLLAAAAAALSIASGASAATKGHIVREGTPTIKSPLGNGQNTIAYNAPNTGSGIVNKIAPRGAPGTEGAIGSLEIKGDRARYVIGSEFQNFAGSPAKSLGSLASVSTMVFDWQTVVAGSGQKHGAPAVRLHILDNNIRSEMIWEHVYNGGTSGVAPPSGWQTSGFADKFYVNVRDNDGAAFLAQNPGLGLTINGGTQGEVYKGGGLLTQSIGDWQSFFSANAFVTGLSFGAGGGFGSNYVGNLDNVRIGMANGDLNVINFEAVPEPATWAMMIGGFGLVGAAARRRSSKAVLA